MVKEEKFRANFADLRRKLQICGAKINNLREIASQNAEFRANPFPQNTQKCGIPRKLRVQSEKCANCAQAKIDQN